MPSSRQKGEVRGRGRSGSIPKAMRHATCLWRDMRLAVGLVWDWAWGPAVVLGASAWGRKRGSGAPSISARAEKG